MKMKKLLAGVLSAAMVATMIPAGMAFSVSAAPEDSLVASYDFTTSTGTGSWTDATWSAVGEGVTITSGTGAVITGGDDHSSIYTTNALKDNAANGFSVVMNVAVTDNATNFGGLFGFASDAADVDANFFNVTGSGTGIHHTYTDGFYDIVSGSTVLGSTMQEYAITVSDDQICIYVNGSQCVVYNHDDTDQGSTWPQYPGYHIDSTSLVNSVDDFVIGYLGFWEGATATVQDVALYSSVLTEEEIADMSGVEPVEPALISAYNFDGNLNNSVEGAGAAVTVAQGAGGMVGDEISTSVEYVDGAVKLSPDNGYGLKLDVDTSKIQNNTFTVSFDVSYQSIAANLATMFIGAQNQQTSQLWYSIGNGYSPNDYEEANYMIWYYSSAYGQLNSGSLIALDEMATLTATFSGTNAVLYLNGVEIDSGTVPAIVGKNTNFYLGVNAWDPIADITVDNVRVYNYALSADEVAEGYAQSIADDLNITMRGRQAGTIDGETAVRFVANLDQDAINDNEAVTKLGWAAENGTTVAENATGYMLNTVTSDSNLAATGKYAYTYVQATKESVAVLPCVQITVNGNAYWFAYDGISGSALSTEASAVVSAIDVEGVFAAAAESTMA